MINIIKNKALDIIEIKTNNYTAQLSNFGASLYRFIIDDKDMLLTVKDFNEFVKIENYHGKTIGRFANRIKGNKVTINNIEYILDNNEGPNTLHGGLNGISTKFFNYNVKELDDEYVIVFDYLSVDKESGFPGNLNIKITYTFKKDIPTFIISFEGISDKDTICSLTNHAFFTLGKESILDSNLYINGNKYINTCKDDLLPINVLECDERLNFSNGLELNKYIDDPDLLSGKAKGYDHYIYFNNINTLVNQVTLKNDLYELNIKTDFEGTQIYSDNYKNNCEFYGTNEVLRKSIAIEPCDSFMKINILKANDVYQRFIEYSFKRR